MVCPQNGTAVLKGLILIELFQSQRRRCHDGGYIMYEHTGMIGVFSYRFLCKCARLDVRGWFYWTFFGLFQKVHP